MNEQALLRKLRRAAQQNEAQVGIGRSLGAYGGQPFGADAMREQIQEEIARRRDHLAELLLQIAVENGLPADEWASVASYALVAATVIHPDLPAEEGAADA